MSTLKELLLSATNRPKVIQDAVRLVDSEVDSKGGLSGIAVKGAYKVVKGVKPGLIAEVVESLIDRFVDKLEPFYAEWEANGKKGAFDAYLDGRRNKVANALLGVTDDRARQVANPTIKKSYQALRPQGEKHVEAAVPGLGKLLNRYLS